MLSEKQVNHINGAESLLQWQSTDIFKQFIRRPERIVALFTGNQAMKTSSTAFQYVLRILGRHPVPEKNVLYFVCESRYCKNGHKNEAYNGNKNCKICHEELDQFSGHKYSIITKPKDNICTCCNEPIKIHKRKTKTFRFASEIAPTEKGDTGNKNQSTETRNTVYPEFKKWLPPYLIKTDITMRSPKLVLKNPFEGRSFDGLEYEGGDIIVEFVSYNQSNQATAGVQRLSCWLDEESPQQFYNEQLPRLAAENGDLIISLTPANYITWTYDEIFERASIYIRSNAILDFLRIEAPNTKAIEKTDSILDIAIIQAATDDNPTLSKRTIEDLFSMYDDPDDLAIRRYGIFKQVSGRIFKDFDLNVHVISTKYMTPDEIPDSWTHGRAIDYHSQTPWACICMSISPEDEAFVWIDYNPSPEKMTTREMIEDFYNLSRDYKFSVNLIDPLAETIKKDTISILDDINRISKTLKRDGLGDGGYWQTWDTKGEKGRDEIKKRIKNSLRVGRPFNNRAVEKGKEVYLPTLWVLSGCKNVSRSLRQWSWEEWGDAKSKSIKEAKNKPMQKWSHFPMAIEALFKNRSFRPKIQGRITNNYHNKYFKRRR